MERNGTTTSSINEAETAFVRRQFVRSLRLSNAILERGCCVAVSSSSSSAAAAASGSGSAAGSDGDMICVQCPLLPRTNTAADTGTNDWRIRMPSDTTGSSRRLSMYDRAAAIVLQSAYEIESGMTGDAAAGTSSARRGAGRSVCSNGDRDDRDQRLISNLSILNRYYDSAAMPLEVACIYIQFCAAIGWRNQALTFAIEVLAAVLRRRDSMAVSSENDDKDWLQIAEKCEELLYLVLTDLLPRVKSSDDCEELFQHLLLAGAQGHGPLSRSSAEHVVQISDEIQPSSVDSLLTNLERLKKTRNHCFSGVIEECTERLQHMQEEFSKEDAQVPADTTSSNDVISSVAERISTRSTAPASNTSTDKDIDDSLPSSSTTPESISDMIQSNIVEPLWESDDRWTNRAVVAGVGITSVLLWRRRRQIRAASRSTGHALLAPFREIVEAFSMQADKR
mmetsp:Transcript_26918/g.58852  ORF Transcript_26918/g.58852 Transcript_26918/m.58852 type:complete len:452 (+) Transcript_26918:126-1481(+)